MDCKADAQNLEKDVEVSSTTETSKSLPKTDKTDKSVTEKTAAPKITAATHSVKDASVPVNLAGHAEV